MSVYGDAGKAYVNWCASMAESLNVGVPWIMCQQSDAPEPMINTCNGWYCDQFTPNNPNSPKMWTENWTGWFKSWGGKDPHRTAEDLAFSVARFFQLGGSFQNYYMVCSQFLYKMDGILFTGLGFDFAPATGFFSSTTAERTSTGLPAVRTSPRRTITTLLWTNMAI